VADVKFVVVANITYDRIDELRGALRREASAAVRKAAYDIEAAAKQAAPVDTGFLRNSIYTVTSQGSRYGGAQARAENRRSEKYAGTRRSRRLGKRVSVGGRMLPEVDGPASDLDAIVAVGAGYGAYVELGTSRMAGRPFLGPAAEAVRPAFEAAMRRLLG
jgi:HK97 gp10 family phage protein